MGKYSQIIERHIDLKDIRSARILLDILEEIRMVEEEERDDEGTTTLYVVTQAEADGYDCDYTVADIVSSEREAERIKNDADSNQTRHVYEIEMSKDEDGKYQFDWYDTIRVGRHIE